MFGARSRRAWSVRLRSQGFFSAGDRESGWVFVPERDKITAGWEAWRLGPLPVRPWSPGTVVSAALEEQAETQGAPSSSSCSDPASPAGSSTMTKLNAQVKGSLNVTTPGVQIWRIEVSACLGRRRALWAWDGPREVRALGLLDGPPSRPACTRTPGTCPQVPSPTPPQASATSSRSSSSSPSHIRSPCRFPHALLLLALPLPILPLVKRGREAWGPGGDPSDPPFLSRPCRWYLFLPAPMAASSTVTAT